MWASARLRHAVGVLLLAFACWLASGIQLQAQGDKKKTEPEPIGDYPFWKTDPGFGVQADATMIAAAFAYRLSGHPFGLLGTRVLLSESDLLDAWRYDFEKVPPLDPRALNMIEDHRPLPNVFRKEPAELKRYELGWYAAFNEALRLTAITPEEKFKNSATKYENVSYPRLKTVPEKYRGKIISVKGKLAVLREVDAPRFAGGLEHIYTGWINGPTERAPPYVVALTELPEGVEKPSEKLNLEVTFHGYFLSLVRFPAEKGERKAKNEVSYPYLVGKIVSVRSLKKDVSDGQSQPLSYYYIVAVLGAMVGIALLVLVLNIWLRRGDSRVQSQLAEVRERHNPFSLEPAEETPAKPDESAESGPPPPASDGTSAGI